MKGPSMYPLRRFGVLVAALALSLGVVSPASASAEVTREKTNYQLVDLFTDQSRYLPMEIGRIYTTWFVEFSAQERRDATGTTVERHLSVGRQEMWLIAPGQIGSRLTLYGTGEDWDFKVMGPAMAARASGTVTLRSCSGCPIIGTGVVEVTATAIDTFHFTDRVPSSDPSGTGFYQVNGRDNTAVGQLTLDGAVVDSGMRGWIQDVKIQRVDAKP